MFLRWFCLGGYVTEAGSWEFAVVVVTVRTEQRDDRVRIRPLDTSATINKFTLTLHALVHLPIIEFPLLRLNRNQRLVLPRTIVLRCNPLPTKTSNVTIVVLKHR